MEKLAIIAVDPGKRTGVAEWIDDTFWSTELDVNDFFDYLHDRVHELYTKGYRIAMVAESFIITINTAKNTQSGWSLELIGVMKFLAHRYHLDDVSMQSPSVGKTFGTNSKLKYLGWYRTGMHDGIRYVGHANDAARHLATFAARRGLIFTREQLADLADV